MQSQPVYVNSIWTRSSLVFQHVCQSTHSKVYSNQYSRTLNFSLCFFQIVKEQVLIGILLLRNAVHSTLVADITPDLSIWPWWTLTCSVLNSFTSLFLWWRMTGSNRRPPACKAGALPAELIPQKGNSKHLTLSLSRGVYLGWWVWLDSNQRPPPYQDGALTSWATDPTDHYLTQSLPYSITTLLFSLFLLLFLTIDKREHSQHFPSNSRLFS